MKITKANSEDFNVIYSFIQKLWDYNTYDSTKIKKVYQKVLEDNSSFMYLLYEEEQPIGFCHGSIIPTFWLSGDTCYISSLYVDPQQRKKGYGKCLLDYVKKEMKEKQCQALILDSGFPRTAAHQFYEHYGFEKSCYGFDYLLTENND